MHALRINCDFCDKPIADPGGLIFSPPHGEGQPMVVTKLHVCVACWPDIVAMKGKKREP